MGANPLPLSHNLFSVPVVTAAGMMKPVKILSRRTKRFVEPYRPQGIRKWQMAYPHR